MNFIRLLLIIGVVAFFLTLWQVVKELIILLLIGLILYFLIWVYRDFTEKDYDDEEV